MPADLAAAHYKNFLYATTARRWHALWCRWAPDGALKESFHAERSFTPTEARDAVDMGVIYHYGGEKGTVSEGPRCGPWRITEAEHSAGDGLLHPSSADMTTLMLPASGPSAWCMKRSAVGEQPCAVELFLHHGEHLRMSAGVIHTAAGELMQLSAIREDARGPFPGAFWSGSTEAATSDGAGLAAALASAGAPVGAKGTGHAITADLQQRALSGVEWSATRMANAVAEKDVVLLCPDSIAVVGTRKRAAGERLRSACAWWPPAGSEDGSAGSGAPTHLYTIEATWDEQGALVEVTYLVFTA